MRPSSQYTRSTSAATCGAGFYECLVSAATFQRPTATLGPRILQISAKISF